ncbi:L-glutamate gamma-semialdehyde dehydrogenase [Desulfomarina sp.]
MENGFYSSPPPQNETILDYEKGSPERQELKAELERQQKTRLDIPLLIGGKEMRTGRTATAVCPHDHHHILADFHQAGKTEVADGITAALKASPGWKAMGWQSRASVFLRAAELISGKYRSTLNAATMLNQSKSVYQAEIDSACELADFLRFNVYYMEQIYREQPLRHTPGTWNRTDYRPLEGFIFAVTPFNFTAIAGNLPTSAAMMGNVVVWKPASTSLLSSWYVMRILLEAGLPPGVINFIPGPGWEIGPQVLKNSNLAGIHFTGSTRVFNTMWQTVAGNIDSYKNYPRIVGETGGKDFVFVHSSAAPKTAAVALARGAFEYQGQKCSAASRGYIPASLWPAVKTELGAILEEIKKQTGDPADFMFYNALIDEAAFDKTMAFIGEAEKNSSVEIIFGGNGDKTTGYFIEPTVLITTDPLFRSMEEELFAPVLTLYIYEDDRFEDTLSLCDKTSPYALTGSILANDRNAVALATDRLRYSAGNFYINDKPTGAVVGQQPFGGARGSGTNDKAGSLLNLLRWTSPRTIKETFVPPEDYRYPFMD